MTKPASPAADSSNKQSSKNGTPSTADGAKRTHVRINGRFLLMLTVFMAVLGGGVYWLHGMQMRRNAESLFDFAEESIASGDTEQATRYLAQYLRFRPEDHDARVQLADVLAQTSQSPRSRLQVLRQLEQVLREDPERKDAAELRYRAVNLCLSLGRYTPASVHLKNLRLEKSDYKPAELTILDARIQEGTRAYQEAILKTLEAIQQSPTTVDSFVRLARLVRTHRDDLPNQKTIATRLPKLDAALAALFPRRLAKKKSGDTKAAAKKEEGPEADLAADAIVERIYEFAMAKGRPHHEVLLRRSQFFTSRGGKDDLEKAHADISEAIKKAPNNPDILNHAADLELARARRLFSDPVEKEVVTKRLAQHETHLKTADDYAARGLKLKPPERLQFYATQARIDRQRAFAVKPSERSRHDDAALQHVKDGQQAIAAFQKESGAKLDLKQSKQLVREKIDLQTIRVELALAKTRTPDGDVDKEAVKDYQAQLQELVRLGAQPMQLALFQAHTQLLQEKWRDAIQTLSAARRQLAGNREWRRRLDFALAGCYEQLHDTASQIRALETGLRGDANWHAGRMRLARILVDLGRFNDAEFHYTILSSAGISQALLPFVRMQTRRLALMRPEDRRLTAVEKNLDSAEKADLDNITVSLLRVEAMAIDPRIPKTERFVRMAKFLDERLKKQPKQVELSTARARIEARRTDRDETSRIRNALKYLQQAETDRKSKLTDDDRLILATARAEISGQLPKKEAKPALDKLKATADALPKGAQRRLYEVLADAYDRAGFAEDSLQLKRAVIERAPNNLQARLVLAVRSIDNGKWRDELKEIRRIEGNGGPWGNYIEAVAIITQAIKKYADELKAIEKLAAVDRELKIEELRKTRNAEIERAHRLLKHAARQQPRQPAYWHQLGRTAAVLGDAREAYENYSRAIDLGDRSSRAFVFAVQYQLSKGDFEGADRILRRAATSAAPLLSPERLNLADRRLSLSKLALMVASRRGEFNAARDLVPRESGEFRDKVVLGLLKFAEYQSLSDAAKKAKRGQTLLKDARKLHEDAVAMAKDAPGAWTALVAFLVRIDQLREAESVIKAALAKLPDDKKDTTAAQCYIYLKKYDDAERHLNAAVARKPKDAALRLSVARFHASRGKLENAGPHLNRILEQESDATRLQREAARQLRILIISRGGRYEDAAKALSLLDGLKKSRISDLYARVAILQRSTLKADRIKLIDVLERIDKRQPLTPRNRFQLARLYEFTGRWDEARTVTEGLIEKDPTNSLYLSWLAIATLRNEGEKAAKIKAARKLLDSLRAVAPNTVNTAAVECRILSFEKKPIEAAAVMERWRAKFLTGKKEVTLTQQRSIYFAADLCENLKLHAMAEKLFKEYARVSKRPENILALATFYGRRARYTEALNICRRAAKTCQPVAIAVTAANVVALGRPSKAELQTALTMVADSLKSDPDSIRSQAVLAALMTSAGKYDEAETRYRQILAKSPRSVGVKNNLAWLLAMRNQKLNEARTLIDEAIAQVGPVAELLDTRSTIHMRTDNPQQALDDLQRSVRENDNDPAYHLHLGQAHLALNNKEAAKTSLRRAVDLGLSVSALHPLEHPGAVAALKAVNLELPE